MTEGMFAAIWQIFFEVIGRGEKVGTTTVQVVVTVKLEFGKVTQKSEREEIEIRRIAKAMPPSLPTQNAAPLPHFWFCLFPFKRKSKWNDKGHSKKKGGI